MKGIIFNLVEDVVVADHGVDVWDDVLDCSGVLGAYTAVGTYPDEELQSIVGNTAQITDTSPTDVLRHIGRRSMPLFRERYPEFFQDHSTCRGFLGSLNGVIHPEVRKLYSGAQPPHFEFSDAEDGALLVEYHSQRSMCIFAEGLILGTGDVFGERIDVTQPQCKMQGAPVCILKAVKQ